VGTWRAGYLFDGGVLDCSLVPVQRGPLVAYLEIVFVAMHKIVHRLGGFYVDLRIPVV